MSVIPPWNSYHIMIILELHRLAQFAPSNGFIKGHDWSRRRNTHSLENPESFKGCIQIMLLFRVRCHLSKLLLANGLTYIGMVHFSNFFSLVYPYHFIPPQIISEVCVSISGCTLPSTLSNLMINVIEGKLTC